MGSFVMHVMMMASSQRIDWLSPRDSRQWQPLIESPFDWQFDCHSNETHGVAVVEAVKAAHQSQIECETDRCRDATERRFLRLDTATIGSHNELAKQTEERMRDSMSGHVIEIRSITTGVSLECAVTNGRWLAAGSLTNATNFNGTWQPTMPAVSISTVGEERRRWRSLPPPPLPPPPPPTCREWVPADFLPDRPPLPTIKYVSLTALNPESVIRPRSIPWKSIGNEGPLIWSHPIPNPWRETNRTASSNHNGASIRILK